MLERELGTLLRKTATRVASAEATPPIAIDDAVVRDALGRQKFFDEVAERTALPGVATGLAWTPVGGDILFVEATSMPGKGQLILTGQLGDVMKESAQIALSYVRAHADRLGVDPAARGAQVRCRDLHACPLAQERGGYAGEHRDERRTGHPPPEATAATAALPLTRDVVQRRAWRPPRLGIDLLAGRLVDDPLGHAATRGARQVVGRWRRLGRTGGNRTDRHSHYACKYNLFHAQSHP